MSTIEINIANTYWGMLRFLSDEVKLRLAGMLTSSVNENINKSLVANKQSATEQMLAKYAGALNDDRSADEINSSIISMRSSKKIQDFTM